MTHASPWPRRGLLTAGCAVTGLATVLGVVRPFLDHGEMPGHPMRLRGMPLADMPEMFAAAAGLLMVLGGVALSARARTSSWPAVPRSPAARWLVTTVVTGALVIDVSKTSTLGFVIPGMREEYGLTPSMASLQSVSGLTGTAVGALLFTRIAHRLGRRGTYLMATLAFTATSMCGMMPTFAGNIVMCLLMGTAVGGLAPLIITILRDLFPGPGGGPVVAGLSMAAAAAGYLVASGGALWLEPIFGWRILWLIGAPTGILLALVTLLVPERDAVPRRPAEPEVADARLRLARTAFTGGLQRVYAFAVGLATFGLSTWLPTLSRSTGLSLTVANSLLTIVALVMVPCAVLLILAYRRSGPVPVALWLALGTAVLLGGLALSGVSGSLAWLSVLVLALSLFTVNTMAATFLPVAADLAESGTRDRETGSVSFANRIGGLTGPLVLSLIVSSVGDVLIALAGIALVCGLIAGYTGHRQRIARRQAEDRVPVAAGRD